MFGVKSSIAGAGHADGDRVGKDAFKDVAGATGMVVGGHHNNAVPILLGDKGSQGLGLFSGIVSILGKPDDAVFGDTAFDEVVFHQFGDTCGGTQTASTSYHNRSQFL